MFEGVGAARLSSQSWHSRCWVKVKLLHILHTQGQATVWIVCGSVAAHLESKTEPFKDCLVLQSLKSWPHPCEASRLPLVSLSALLSSEQTEWCFKSPLQSFNFHQECCVPQLWRHTPVIPAARRRWGRGMVGWRLARLHSKTQAQEKRNWGWFVYLFLLHCFIVRMLNLFIHLSITEKQLF